MSFSGLVSIQIVRIANVCLRACFSSIPGMIWSSYIVAMISNNDINSQEILAIIPGMTWSPSCMIASSDINSQEMLAIIPGMTWPTYTVAMIESNDIHLQEMLAIILGMTWSLCIVSMIASNDINSQQMRFNYSRYDLVSINSCNDCKQ